MNRLNKLYSELSIKDQEIQNNKEILKLLAEKMYETQKKLDKAETQFNMLQWQIDNEHELINNSK